MWLCSYFLIYFTRCWHYMVLGFRFFIKKGILSKNKLLRFFKSRYEEALTLKKTTKTTNECFNESLFSREQQQRENIKDTLCLNARLSSLSLQKHHSNFFFLLNHPMRSSGVQTGNSQSQIAAPRNGQMQSMCHSRERRKP